MESASAVATVTALQVTAVKGFQVRQRSEVLITAEGIPGDRCFAVIDEHDAVLTVGGTSAFLPYWSSFDVDEGRLAIGRGDEVVLADEVVTSASLRIHYFGDRYGIGHVVAGPWADFLSDVAGQAVRLVRTSGPLGGYDVHTVTLVAEASVRALGEDADGGPLDGRRFRMTVGLEGLPAFGEDALSGATLALGSRGCSLSIGGPVKRCAAVQRHPEGSLVRLNTLKRIHDVRGTGTSELGRGLNLGVYGEVVSPGPVCVGDPARTNRPAGATRG